MKTVSALRRQLESAQDLQSIVKTMKAMAAASIWQYEQAVSSLAEYQRTVELGLQIALRNRPEGINIDIAQPHELDEPQGAIIFGSEQGLVGNFNDEISRYALRQMEIMGVPKEQRSVIAVGQRIKQKLTRAHQPLAQTLRMPTSAAGIRPMVQQLMIQIEHWLEKENVVRIVLFYNAPSSGTRYVPRAVRLIPVAPEWLERLQTEPWESNTLPLFDAPWEKLFADLIREYFYVAVFRAFAASLAAENTSRLAAMEAAESNIQERLEKLEQQHRQVRQQSITSELLDIIAGAEAAAGDSEYSKS